MTRFWNLIVAAFLLVLFFLPMCLTAVAIRLTMGSPLFFRQVRPGLNGKPFSLFKFRTMNESRDSLGNLLPDGYRITRLGHLIRKTSLDELPQLFNVILGNMNLVGPRPLLMEYLPLYNSEQARRHQVKPGITGWAQVNGRNAISWEDKFELDVWYVNHRSFRLDMYILWLTVRRVIAREDISAQGDATMPKFHGAQR